MKVAPLCVVVRYVEEMRISEEITASLSNFIFYFFSVISDKGN